MSSRCRPRGFCARVGEWPGRAVTRGEVTGPGPVLSSGGATHLSSSWPDTLRCPTGTPHPSEAGLALREMIC